MEKRYEREQKKTFQFFGLVEKNLACISHLKKNILNNSNTSVVASCKLRSKTSSYETKSKRVREPINQTRRRVRAGKENKFSGTS